MLTFHRLTPWHLAIVDTPGGVWASRGPGGRWRLLDGAPECLGPRLAQEQVTPQHVLGLRMCFADRLPDGALLARLVTQAASEGRPWRVSLLHAEGGSAGRLRHALAHTFGSIAEVPDALMGTAVARHPRVRLQRK